MKSEKFRPGDSTGRMIRKVLYSDFMTEKRESPPPFLSIYNAVNTLTAEVGLAALIPEMV